MCAVSPLTIRSLKEQVYDYLREQIHKQVLRPGMSISLERTSQELGISRTPLRDALIQLEMEGFVTIRARRGIYVNGLSLKEIEQFYQVIGALEQSALMKAGKDLGAQDIEELHRLNGDMRRSLDEDDFDRFYALNLTFHNIFLRAAQNAHLIRIVDNLKKRLYDFPKQENWLKAWELSSVEEHQQVVTFLQNREFSQAARYLHDVHWGFDYQRVYIERYYFPEVSASGGQAPTGRSV